jgi:hypothetical protein
MATQTVTTVTDKQATALMGAMMVAAENNPNGLELSDIQEAFLDNFRIQNIEALPAEAYQSAEAYIALAGMKDGGDRSDPAVARLWDLITGESRANERVIVKAIEDVQTAQAGLWAYREAVKRLNRAAEALAGSVESGLNLAGHGYGRGIAESMVAGRLTEVVAKLYEIQSIMASECHNITVLAKAIDEMDAKNTSVFIRDSAE